MGRIRLDARRAGGVSIVVTRDPRLLRRVRHAAQLSQSRWQDHRVADGRFDQPERVPPTYEVGTETKLAWLEAISAMTGKTTTENSGAAAIAKLESYQHPDHNTGADWMPASTRPAG